MTSGVLTLKNYAALLRHEFFDVSVPEVPSLGIILVPGGRSVSRIIAPLPVPSHARTGCLWWLACLATTVGVTSVCAPAYATVQIVSITPSLASPQTIGTSVGWTVMATDSNPGPLTFQLRVSLPGQPPAALWDFNLGSLSAGTWVSPSYAWTPTGPEGTWHIEAVVKDFVSGETATAKISYSVSPLVTGRKPVAIPTANPLVALFSAPACAEGSSMRAVFEPQSRNAPSTTTNWAHCSPSHTMTFEIAGMYPSTEYRIFSQTKAGDNIVKGRAAHFTTGALPSKTRFPAFTAVVPPGAGTDTADAVLQWSIVPLANPQTYPNLATDLDGNIIWYYMPGDSTKANRFTRPLKGGHLLSIQDGAAWNPASQTTQLLREIDLAGNIVRETNTGIIQQELLAMGAADAAPCDSIVQPAPVGAACLGAFHHEAIQSLPNGFMAVMTDIEKIFQPGTQGDTSGLPVDIVGDMIVVLDANWQVSWYFDTFQHDGGAPQLDINRTAVLGETCYIGASSCPPMFLLGSGIAPIAKDWLHGNSIYYWPQTHDIIWSARHQDWVMKVDYQDGAGTGNILWRMGLDGDFTFNNIANDAYPWFSHQHDVGIEDEGAGVMTLMDNGDTRLIRLGRNCGPADCESRGMAVTFDETTMQVAPVLMTALGVYAPANGSAQLLADGNYFFDATFVTVTPNEVHSYAIEIGANGAPVLDIAGPNTYRAWQVPSLYDPPTT
jgi:arylsulfate sulfotransferase